MKQLKLIDKRDPCSVCGKATDWRMLVLECPDRECQDPLPGNLAATLFEQKPVCSSCQRRNPDLS